jgi:hypothetical protein
MFKFCVQYGKFKLALSFTIEPVLKFLRTLL